MDQSNSSNLFSLRGFFQAVKDAILPDPGWPESEMPLIRHRPLPDDTDIAFYNDMRYLEALADVIEDRCRFEGGRLPDWPQVESQAFWDGWDWPDDAAVLLIEWRTSRHGADWLNEDTALGTGPW